MSLIEDQNKSQFILSNFNEERSSVNSFSEQDKKQLLDFYSLLLEWDIEDKEEE